MVTNKSELAAKIANDADITVAKANEAIESFLAALTEIQSSKDPKAALTLVGFGRFYQKNTKERMGINPKTKEKIKIPGKTSLGFKAAKPSTKKK